jgi:Carboxypeptidase regulatory-like domain
MTKRWLAVLLLFLPFVTSATELTSRPPASWLFLSLCCGPAAGAELAGRVVDPEGSPIAGAAMTVRAESSPVVTYLECGEDGSFLLEELPPGPVTLTFQAAGYEGVERQVFSGASLAPLVAVLQREDFRSCKPPSSEPGTDAPEPDVPSGQSPLPVRDDADEALEQGSAPVSGRVLDDHASPLAGARIVAWRENGDGRVTGVVSGPDGRFTLGLLDGTYSLNIQKPGFQDLWWSGLQIAGPPAADLEIRLQRAVVLRGHLAGISPGQRPALRATELRSDARRTAKVALDEYSFADLSPGTWSLEGVTTDCTLRRTIKILPGTTEMVLDLDFSAMQGDSKIDHGATRKDGSFALDVSRGEVLHLTISGLNAEVAESRPHPFGHDCRGRSCACPWWSRRLP